MDIKKFWQAVLKQDANEIRQWFEPRAQINWHCTNERFTVEEFVKANCRYPGLWDGVVQRVERLGNLIVTVTKVYSQDDKKQSFHAVSFFNIEDDKIVALDEYWCDDADAPEWRKALNIGTPITK